MYTHKNPHVSLLSIEMRGCVHFPICFVVFYFGCELSHGQHLYHIKYLYNLSQLFNYNKMNEQ